MAEEHVRRKSTESSINALSEHMAIYRDAALCLINDAEEKDKEVVQQIVTGHLQTVRDDIGQILNGTVSFEDYKALKYPDPKISEIDLQANHEISDLILEVRNRIGDLIPEDDYDAEIVTTSFILIGILKSIEEMRIKVRRETAKPVKRMGLRKKTLDGFSPAARDWLRKIRDADLYNINGLTIGDALKPLKKYFGIDSNREIEKEIGLEETIQLVIHRTNSPEEQYKINDGVKLHNWLLKMCIELARQEEHTLLSYVARHF